MIFVLKHLKFIEVRFMHIKKKKNKLINVPFSNKSNIREIDSCDISLTTLDIQIVIRMLKHFRSCLISALKDLAIIFFLNIIS